MAELTAKEIAKRLDECIKMDKWLVKRQRNLQQLGKWIEHNQEELEKTRLHIPFIKHPIFDDVGLIFKGNPNKLKADEFMVHEYNKRLAEFNKVDEESKQKWHQLGYELLKSKYPGYVNLGEQIFDNVN